VPAHPPDWAVAAVNARGEWAEIRHLEALVESPTLRHDGTVLDFPGYDERTGLLYEPNAEFPAIAKRPSREDARRAAKALLALVDDFPFVRIEDPAAGTDDGGMAHRAVWLAALLTPLARFSIAGPCPLFMFDANTPGTGKSLLTDVIAILCTGRIMPRTTYPDSDEEMRKRITAIALAGDLLMLIDNIAAPFGGSSLDSALTAMTWRDRVLGRSESTPELPLSTVWYGTGNNVVYRGDALRRVIPCRLETAEERPEERSGFAIRDLKAHVKAERPRLVAAALTVLRAHAAAGSPRPEPALTPMDYPAWCDVVRNAVYWAIGVDPCQTRKALYEGDPEALARKGLVEGWAELPGCERGLTVAQALRVLNDPENAKDYLRLRDVLMELSRTDGLPSAKAIGQRLKAIKGRFIGGKAIQAVPYQGTQRWRVVEAPSGGFGGFGGIVSNPGAGNCADKCSTNSGETEAKRTHQSHQSHRDDLAWSDPEAPALELFGPSGESPP
jgi:hypothetical protein